MNHLPIMARLSSLFGPFLSFDSLSVSISDDQIYRNIQKYNEIMNHLLALDGSDLFSSPILIDTLRLSIGETLARSCMFGE